MIFDAAIVDISHSSFLHFLLKRFSVFDTWAPALESLLFWESRGPEGAGTRFQRYLPESCHPPQSWFWSAAQGSQLPHQAAFWPLNHIFWGVMKISRWKVCPLLGFVSHLLDPLPAHLMFLRLTAPSSLPHFHNKVGWEEQQRKFPTFLPGISGGTRAHHTEACVQIFHVFPQIGFGQRGCPRPHPMPTGRPTPMFDFFLTTPGEPVGAPTPTGFLTGFLSCWTRRQRPPSAGTHVTHGRHLALLGSLTTLDALYQLLKSLTWSRGFQFLLMPVANFSMESRLTVCGAWAWVCPSVHQLAAADQSSPVAGSTTTTTTITTTTTTTTTTNTTAIMTWMSTSDFIVTDIPNLPTTCPC